MADLDGMIAFVTGAGSGLGREIALTFARAGARVAVNDLRPDAAADVARALGPSLVCDPLVGDVADPRAVRDWFDRLEQASAGRLDILVNNAGYADADAETMARLERQVHELTTTGRVTTPLDATQRMTDERWSRMLAVHLNGTFHGTREALRLMSPRRSGRIINPGEHRRPDRHRASQTLVGRLGEAREIAATALFLAGPGATYFTGQVLSPNGGLVV